MSIRRDVLTARLVSLGYAACAAAIGVAWFSYPAVVSPAFQQIDQFVTAIAFGVIGWFAFKARRARAPRMAFIWLRRFHVEEPPRYPFQKLMELLSDHGVIACTLQDSKVRTSHFTIRAFKRDNMPEFNKRAHRSIGWWGFRLAVAGLVLFLVMLLSGMVLVPNLGLSPLMAGILTISAGAATFLGLTVRHLLRERRIWNEMLNQYLQSIKIDEHELPDIEKTMQSISFGKGLRAGTYVFDVVDAAWKRAVAAVSSGARAVLFDVSELTENMRFELEVLAERFAAESVVVAWAVRDLHDPQQPSPNIIHELERSFGPGSWAKFKKLPYLWRSLDYTDCLHRLLTLRARALFFTQPSMQMKLPRHDSNTARFRRND